MRARIRAEVGSTLMRPPLDSVETFGFESSVAGYDFPFAFRNVDLTRLFRAVEDNLDFAPFIAVGVVLERIRNQVWLFHAIEDEIAGYVLGCCHAECGMRFAQFYQFAVVVVEVGVFYS